ncbi:flagellar filament capping protein FliD [Azohydromonas caseinilytica]|uniref:Flagellar hook-associated protein 2 n=1 Tax=Azohydromonas caseinilytica TaxID=2728836 RepID=A0A848F840_9BURK|nr:flagellar filament capping protein FliD [Azohydromonas caseinilytica]NML14885.1 flagellar filament capping protein FliD [Azohydromonas caseinilytica]
MAISSTGIGSGLDVSSIMSQLVTLERKPIATLQTAATKIQTQISAYGKVQSLVSTLRDTAAALGSSSLWKQTSATSSDTTTVSAATTGSAAAGEYTVAVSSIARAQTLYSRALSSAVGAGTMTIQIVQEYGPPPVLKDGTSALDLTFTDPGTTVEQVRDRINAAGIGVTASVVRDATGAARLALTSQSTGLGSRIMVTGDFADFNYQPGLVGGMTQAQAAQNAQFTINGVPAESGSNQVSNAMDGLSLILVKEGTAKVTLSNDETAQKKAIDDFVAAYNALNNYLAEQTKYDAGTKKAGNLQGDSAAMRLRSELRSLAQSSSGLSTAFKTLSSVGLEMQKDGTLKANSTRLAEALKQPTELGKLFTSSDAVTVSNNGFGVRFRQLGDTVTGTDGFLTSRTDSLQGKLKRNQTEQERLEERVVRWQTRLEKQYQALDAKMGSINALSSYVSQQVAQWNKSTG